MASDLFYGEGISKVNEATRPDVGKAKAVTEATSLPGSGRHV
jgi:hypothetical protein